MSTTLISYSVPHEIAALIHEARQEGKWLRMRCPWCDPEGRKGRALALGERGWLCHRCHAEEFEHAGRVELKRLALDNRSSRAAENKSRARALQIWEESREIKPGSIFDRHLEWRGLRPVLSPRWSPALRCHPRVYHSETERHYSAIIGLVVDVANMPCAIHRIYFMPDGRRADADDVPEGWRVGNAKKAYGDIKYGAIRLGYDLNADTIGIAEGIESALGLAMRLRVPCWSTISAGGMRDVRIPKDIRRVIIGPDIGDPGNPRTGHGKQEGTKAAITLRERLLAEAKKDGRRLVVQFQAPPVGARGDWADWAKQAAAL